MKINHRPVSAIILMSICIIFFSMLLCGCSDEDLYKNPRGGSKSLTLKSVPAATQITGGEGAVYGHEGAPREDHSLGAGAGVTQSDDSDYIAKSDIYWKLNYIKTQFDNNKIPPTLANAIDEIRTQTQKTISDDKYPLIIETLGLLKNVLDSDTTEKKMRDLGLEPSTIAWGTGSITMRSQFKQKQGAGYLNANARDRQDMVIKYEETYHSAPADVRRKGMQRACERITRLGDMLGLLNRKANSKPNEIPVAD